ncbi:MAG: hypothetical protein DCC43_16145 [Candidatus Brocadia sp.]|jgi:hypothetical protein|nr:hypothetical protein [Candidatus Brocadia sp.]MDG5997697.1 hypothetical protein [Candidatus Brocadia sp.]RIJ88464.1 MAG: hypothetical protein DCC43_16145 [Candidatus Brocadia sp.]
MGVNPYTDGITRNKAEKRQNVLAIGVFSLPGSLRDACVAPMRFANCPAKYLFRRRNCNQVYMVWHQAK